MKLRFFFVFLFGIFFLSQIGMANAMENVKNEIITKKTEKLVLEIQYPAIGQDQIDAPIAEWAKDLALNFENMTSEQTDETEEGGEKLPFSDQPYELKASYEISRPSDIAISIAWEIYTYTGGVHGNVDFIVLTYDLRDGSELDIYDFFTDLDTALEHLSSYCYRVLPEALGDMYIEDMMHSGASPDADNFTSLALTPTGVRVYFQPYQVGPYAAGSHKIDIPLEELLDAEPRLELWGKSPKQLEQYLNTPPIDLGGKP